MITHSANIGDTLYIISYDKWTPDVVPVRIIGMNTNEAFKNYQAKLVVNPDPIPFSIKEKDLFETRTDAIQYMLDNGIKIKTPLIYLHEIHYPNTTSNEPNRKLRAFKTLKSVRTDMYKSSKRYIDDTINYTIIKREPYHIELIDKENNRYTFKITTIPLN